MTAVVAARWHPGLSDPDLASWAVGGAYVVALVLAGAAGGATRRARRRLVGLDEEEAGRQRELMWVWIVVGAILFVLTIDEAFDLQAGLLDLMRRFAYRNGWYDRRREYQAAFIVALLVAGAAFA